MKCGFRLSRHAVLALLVFARLAPAQTLTPALAGAVEGRAELEGRTLAQARAQAIQQAFRVQVMAAVASRLPDQVRTEQEQKLEAAIYSQAEDFILRYQILNEQVQPPEYVVTMDLTVDQLRLEAALLQGGFVPPVRAGKVFLLILEQRPGSPAQSWWSAGPSAASPSTGEQVFRRRLTEEGYQVIEPSPGQPRIAPERVTNPGNERDQVLRQLQTDYEADLLLVGKARLVNRPDSKRAEAELTLAAVDLTNRETVFRLVRTAAVAEPGEAGAESAALAAAAEGMIPEVLEHLRRKGLSPGEGGLQVVSLTVLNVFNYGVYQAVSERLERPVPGIRKAELRYLSPARAVFAVHGMIEPAKLSRWLTAEYYPGFRLQEVEVSPDGVRLTAAALPGSASSP